ncbi:PQQ-binding-like beta-propeller repeat protein [Streptomyces sp. PKU-EA00015]|uniref:outer membrane protein assembly factor BamB family protein n=1 Tax=Streptomyces sp. PKU-EA00015 TaxID=2748326 RepID=UPI0015A3EB25|nr:PQQ-binding-like beta-propeller repeat protein [Streptomyces sp. PKU-EA00015]NWF28080.1 PQQ-binding-like beta-propeller repeat protein [Streptomyces sp. PKU-EA00015]
MTQPPDRQGPEGGFGAAHHQWQGGAYPPPPAQAPQTPASQTGYGYPQTGPYATPAYGPCPTQPQVPPQPRGPRRFLASRTGRVVAAAVAGLLVAGGVTYAALSGDDEKTPSVAGAPGDAPEPAGSPTASGGQDDAAKDPNAQRRAGDARVLFVTKNETDLPGDGTFAQGPWVVGDTVVKAMYREVTGYSVTDGAKKWTVELDSDLCMAAPQDSPDGKIVIGVLDGHTAKSDCSVLQMIDAKTGRAGWRTTVPKPKGMTGFSDLVLALSGNTVTAVGTGTSFGFSVTDGRQLFAMPSSGCLPYAFAGGSRLIAAAECPTAADEVAKEEIQGIDPATGRPAWRYTLDADWKVDKVFSVAPVAFFAHKEDMAGEVVDKKVFVLTDTGRLRSRIAFGDDEFEPRCGSGAIQLRGEIQGWCAGAAADGAAVYLATKGGHEVVTFGLDTGRRTGVSSAGDDRTITPMTAEDGTVVHHVGPSLYSGGAVATVAPSGGERKVLLRLPKTDAEGFSDARAVFADGRLFLVAPMVQALNDAAERETNTMMAFGK